MRIFLVIVICGSITVLLGAINIWLGALSLPITYGVAESLLRK